MVKNKIYKNINYKLKRISYIYQSKYVSSKIDNFLDNKLSYIVGSK